MLLSWRLHQNPYANANSPLLRDLSAGGLTFKSANFSTTAQGGFANGAMSFGSPTDDLIQDALDNWLMRRVLATDGAGRVAYEGFVAGVRAQQGQHTYLQAMDSFANVVVAEFVWAGSYGGYGKCPKGQQCKGRQYVFESAVDPTGKTLTLLGPKQEWIQVGSGPVSPALAVAEATVKLSETLTRRGVDITTAQPQPNALDVTLWGYQATLQWQKTTVGYTKNTEISAMVKEALTAANRAPFISSDQKQIKNTGRSIPFNSGHDVKWVWDCIQEVISGGDNNNRALYFQIWEDRRPWLTTRATAPRYYSRSDERKFYDASHAPLPPYMVRAGNYVLAENEDAASNYFADVLKRRYRGLVERTEYDDVREELKVPAPTEVVMSPERMLARAYRLLRGRR